MTGVLSDGSNKIYYYVWSFGIITVGDSDDCRKAGFGSPLGKHWYLRCC